MCVKTCIYAIFVVILHPNWIVTNKHLYSIMKKVIYVLLLGCALMGCRSKIDLAGIDTTSEIQMGMALPVGSMHMSVRDFIGGVQNLYVDSSNTLNKGVLTWKFDTLIARDYHNVHLEEYLSSTTLHLKVYDKLGDYIGSDGKITTGATPETITLDFPLTLKLKGINNPGNLSKERLDSAFIETANFSSVIKKENGLPFEWNWINKVTLDLGKQINRAAGNTMTVYNSGDGYNYNDSIPTAVDNFHLVMMKDKSLPPSRQNIVDSCQFMVHFTFTIPANTSVTIPTDAAFNYKLNVQFIEYFAIWGMFDPSNDMHDENSFNLADAWGDLAFLSHSNLPFADPQIDVEINTKVAGALIIDSAYVFSDDHDGNRRWAAFGKDEHRYRQVKFREGDWLPLDSEIGDSTTHMLVRFDSTPEGGRIHRLFDNIPQRLGYRFSVKFDTLTTPQIRVIRDTRIKVDAHCKLPMVFRQGVQVIYCDTARDVNLSQVSLDSLLSEANWIDTMKTTNVKLIIRAKNSIPLQIKMVMRCLDEHDQVLMDPENTLKPLTLFPADTIRFAPPTFEKINNKWQPTKDGETTIIANMTKAKMDVLPKIKSIIYTAIIDDEALQVFYEQGLADIRILDTQGVTFKIGLTANVDAVLNFNDGK